MRQGHEADHSPATTAEESFSITRIYTFAILGKDKPYTETWTWRWSGIWSLNRFWGYVAVCVQLYARILGFLDQSPCYCFQVAPQLYSRGWVDPVPDPLLLTKSGSAGNRARTSGYSHELWPVDHRGGQLYSRGSVDPVPDPLLLRKSGSAGNRAPTSGYSQELSPVDHRGGELYSRGSVGPVPDPLLLRKSGSAGNRAPTSGYSHELWPVDHRGGQLYSRGSVGPVPDPLLLRKSGSAGNRNRTSGSVAMNSDQ
jgi:hypothetical protein